LKKVCYKVSLCENRQQQQSCKAFIRLSIRAKMIVGERPIHRENLADTDPPHCKTPIFARSDSAVTPSKKVQLTLIGSPLRAFQLAQDE